MENPPQTLQKLVAWLQMQAAKDNQFCVIDARIAISPTEAHLLELEPVSTLATIRY